MLVQGFAGDIGTPLHAVIKELDTKASRTLVFTERRIGNQNLGSSV